MSDNSDDLSFGEQITRNMAISKRGEMPLRIVKLARSKRNKQEDTNNHSTRQVNENILGEGKLKKSDDSPKIQKPNNVLAENIGQYSTRTDISKHIPPTGKKVADSISYLLKILSDELDVPYNLERLRRVVANQVTSQDGHLKIEYIINTASQMGFRCDQVHIEKETIRKFSGILVIQYRELPNLIVSATGNEYLTCNSEEGYKDILTSQLEAEIFAEADCIEGFLLTKRNTLMTNRFNLGSFKPYVKKYNKEIIEIFVLSFFIQLVGLFGPLLIQQIIDKVVTKILSSLAVLGSAMIF